jgi:predicted TIM-barrel fold metal-dependent hydrolase
MYGPNLIVDAVAHAYDRSIPNRSQECSMDEYVRVQRNSHVQASALEPVEGGFQLTLEEYTARWSGEALAEAFFLESDVDIVIHHHVHIPYFFKVTRDGGASRWDASLEMARVAPGRVFLYAGVDTFDPDRSRILSEMERMAAQGAVGFKFYPTRGFFDRSRNEFIVARYDDPESAYPFFEKARSLGVRHLAFHKAQPIGPGPIDALRPTDLTRAAAAFPDLTFEVVHDGWAFLEESAMQLRSLPNIYANLEIVANLATRQPRRFAHIIGTLLRDGASERILFASGCGYNHPDPIIRSIMEFEMPQDLCDGYGYPQLTMDIKRKILGLNACTLLGIDTIRKAAELAKDDWSQRLSRDGKQRPWTRLRR